MLRPKSLAERGFPEVLTSDDSADTGEESSEEPVAGTSIDSAVGETDPVAVSLTGAVEAGTAKTNEIKTNDNKNTKNNENKPHFIVHLTAKTSALHNSYLSQLQPLAENVLVS